jgi:hypothetical protein
MPRAVQDQVAIANMALMHLNVGKKIASLNEKSAPARACSQFYDQVKDEVLRDFAWPFATKTASLELVTQQPTVEWGYAYRVPVDCVFARRLLNGNISVAPFPNSFSGAGPYATPTARVLTAQTQIPFRLEADDQGGLVYTDLAPVAAIPATSTSLAQPALPQLEYTMEQDTPQFYPPDFAQAVALLLAVYIAPSITGGDKFKLGERALRLYQWAISRAWGNAGNEEQRDQLPDSEAIRARS